MTLNNETIQYATIVIGLIMAAPWLKQVITGIYKLVMMRIRPLKSVTISGLDCHGKQIMEVVELSDTDKLANTILSVKSNLSLKS